MTVFMNLQLQRPNAKEEHKNIVMLVFYYFVMMMIKLKVMAKLRNF